MPLKIRGLGENAKKSDLIYVPEALLQQARLVVICVSMVSPACVIPVWVACGGVAQVARATVS
jgi:hypothetical protein